MMTTIVAIVTALAAFILILAILLGAVVLGIHREPADAELRHRAPSRTSHVARRLLGVYVRRPDDQDEAEREACLAGHSPGDRERS
jgi:hypothetical protein